MIVNKILEYLIGNIRKCFNFNEVCHKRDGAAMSKDFKVVISDYDYEDFNIEKGEMEKHHIKMVAAQC